jgi:hypothetical protein
MELHDPIPDEEQLVPLEEALGLVRDGKGALQQYQPPQDESECNWEMKYYQERELR